MTLVGSTARSHATPIWFLFGASIVGALSIDIRWGLVVAGVIGGSFLITAHPKYILYFLALSFGLNITVIEEPVHVSIPQLFAVVLVASLLIRRLLTKVPTIQSGRLWSYSGLLFLLTTLPSTLSASSRLTAVIGSIQLLLVALLIYAAAHVSHSKSVQIRTLLALIVAGGVLSVIPAFTQAIFDLGPAAYTRGGLFRVYSTFGQPNSYGHYLAGIVPITLVLTSRHGKYAIALIALVAALILTGSRGAMFSTILACSVGIVLIQWRYRSKALFLTVFLTTIVCVSLFLLPAEFYRSLVTFQDWSASQRVLALLTAWRGIMQRPILGHGAGSFRTLLPDIRLPGLTDDIEMPHNLLLDIWFEFGFVALGCFAILVSLYYMRTVTVYLKTGDLPLLCLTVGTTGLLLGAMFGTLLIRGIEELFALLVAMTAVRIHEVAGDRRRVRKRFPRRSPEASRIQRATN